MRARTSFSQSAGSLWPAASAESLNFFPADRRAPGRMARRVRGLPGARPLFLFAASRLATLLPAIARACDDCPSRVFSSLVAPELGGRFHVGDLPLFSRGHGSSVAIERRGERRGEGDFHRGLRGTRPGSSHGGIVTVIGNVAGVLP